MTFLGGNSGVALETMSTPRDLGDEHRAYAKNAQVVIPTLEEFERELTGTGIANVQPPKAQALHHSP